MKFTKIVGNPPYDGRNYLYLKILDIVNTLSDEIIWLCPKTWVEQTNPHNKVYQHYLDLCEPMISDFVDIDSSNFDIEIISKDLGLFTFNKNTKNPINIYDIAWKNYKNPYLAKSIGQKILKYCKNNNLYNIHICPKKVVGTKIVPKDDYKPNSNKWYIGASLVRGNIGFSDWVYIFGKKDLPQKGKLLKTWFNVFEFDTEKEALNFLDFCNKEIFLFSVLLEKKNNTIHSAMYKYFPTMEDYKTSYLNSDICEKIGITKEEEKYISEELKKYTRFRE